MDVKANLENAIKALPLETEQNPDFITLPIDLVKLYDMSFTLLDDTTKLLEIVRHSASPKHQIYIGNFLESHKAFVEIIMQTKNKSKFLN